MSSFHAHVAQLARAAETASVEAQQGPRTVTVALSEEAQSLPPHIIAATDPIKLNRQCPIFRCPAWAGLPSKPYHLHCVREGVAFPALGLHRFPYYLFGKNTVCDYVLEHPSVSSVHAALIFNKEHDCFVLLDLGSTNGTRVQGKRVEARKPLSVAVGSVIQFGYSTRKYELKTGAPPTVKRGREEEGKEKEASMGGAVTDSAAPASSRSMPETVVAVLSQLPPTSPAPAPLETAARDGPMSSTTEATAVRLHTASATQQQQDANAADCGTSAPKTSAAVAADAVAPPAAEPAAIHLFQLVIKHKDVDNPVSRGLHTKGEAITRSKADALEMVRFIVKQHQSATPVDPAFGFAPWTVEEFVAAVKEYCEVCGKKKMGDLGMVEKGTFSDAIDEAAFRLRRGEVSAPVETQLGIHLLFRCD